MWIIFNFVSSNELPGSPKLPTYHPSNSLRIYKLHQPLFLNIIPILITEDKTNKLLLPKYPYTCNFQHL